MQKVVQITKRYIGYCCQKNNESNEVVVRYITVGFANLQEGEKHLLVKSQRTSIISSSSNARKRFNIPHKNI